ncbi:MAG: transglycosylase SLT domain-containing protein [Anaerolineales bacterium]
MQKLASILSLTIILALTACNLPAATPAPPSPTPGPSPTASLPPAATLPPTAPSTPTPVPSARISAAEKALFNGDFSGAREEFQNAILSSNDPAIQAQAYWGSGKTEFSAGNFAAALNSLRPLTESYPTDPLAPRGWLLLAETYQQLGRYAEAASAYQQYLTLRPGLLDAYAQEERGDSLWLSGDAAAAIPAYQAALAASPADPLKVKIKLGQVYAESGDAKSAISAYDEASAATSDEYSKARIEYLAGAALLAAGESDSGYGRWRNAVYSYPKSYDSYLALVGLVDAAQPVDDFNRGLTDYYAGQYGVALAAFERYAQTTPGHDGTLLYYSGLAQRALENYPAAVNDFDQLIQNYPENRYWAEAWSEKAETQWAYLEDYAAAANTLESFAQNSPESPRAAEFLMQAGRIQERAGNLPEAARLWEALTGRYPSDTLAVEALFQAGIAHYRRGDFARALDTFQRTLILSSAPAERARAQLWVGKSHQALGEAAAATQDWQAAQALDSGGYYSLRARQLILGEAPFSAASNTNTQYDLQAERAAAIPWMRVQFNLPPEIDLNGPGPLAADPRYQRGMEFWQLGMEDQARLEFESLRAAVAASAVDSFRLGNALLDLGLYRPAIFALRNVLTLAGLTEQSASLAAPAYFRHVRYGLYYADIVFPAAQEYSLDPLFLTSVIRQESLFEGFVHSSAGARGLMQIIPSTGASLAEQMGWPPDYNGDSLYSPIVSVRMGAYYLNNNRRLLGNDLYAALAAYNAGPGNAAIWQSLAPNDPDLLLEVIRYKETRDYIRNIYEIFSTYRAVYGIGE